MPVSTTAHIEPDDRSVAWIDDTNTKVIEVALDMIAHGWSPEEIPFQHPHLSLAQIHAALGYYYDHKAEMDAQIKRQRSRKHFGGVIYAHQLDVTIGRAINDLEILAHAGMAEDFANRVENLPM